MAARTNKIRHDDETRKKIQAAQIINRFQKCIAGDVELDPQQVSCGKALLNKVLPELKAIEHASDADNPLTFVQKIELVSPDDDSSTSDTE